MIKNFYKSLLSSSDPYIIAEIGSNHNGSISLGKKIIKLAKSSGANCVKFQSWTPDTLYNIKNLTDKNLKNDIFKYQTTKNQLKKFFDYSKSLKIDFSSSVFSKQEIDFVTSKLNVPFIKIASMDLNNIDLISYAAKKNKPLVISTGLSTLSEIDNAIKAIEENKNNEIVILHCVSNYPPKDSEVNLKNIETLSKLYPYPVGFSDHSIGTAIPLAAIALGAKIIEKHFTIDKKLDGWDHAISANPNELSEICNSASRIVSSLGSYSIKRIESKEKIKNFRRSCISNIDLNPGDIISMNNIEFKRPGTGIPPNRFDLIEGKVVKNKIYKNSQIKLKDLE